MIYQLSVTLDFAAAHIVRGHAGKCARLHGHNWKVWIRVQCETLNDLSMGMDFADLKALSKTVIDPLDHQFLNEIPPFDVLNPTAEALAKYLYESIQTKLPTGIQMHSIELFETDNCSVIYKA